MKTLIAGLVLAATTVACDGGGGGIALTDLAAKLQAASCAAQVACDEMPDDATCEATAHTDSTEQETLLAEVKAGTVIYNSELASQCIAFLQNACEFQGAHVVNPCLEIFDGTLAVGSPCEEDQQCKGYKAQAATCVATDETCAQSRETTCCPGICTATPPLAASGAACVPGASCVAGYYCAETTETCQPIVTTAGAACDGFDGCADPMYCNETETGTEVCALAAATGQACDPTAQGPCASSNAYCDATTLLCIAKAAVGAACSATVPCVGEANCDVSGLCVAIPTEGQPCYTGGGVECLGDRRARRRRCARSPPRSSRPARCSATGDARRVPSRSAHRVARHRARRGVWRQR